MRDRTGELCRFRLMGQLSQTVLMGLLDDHNEFSNALISVPLSSVPRELAFETTILDLKSKRQLLFLTVKGSYSSRPLLKQTDIRQQKTLPKNFVSNTNLGLSKFQSSQEILTALNEGEKSDLDKLLAFDVIFIDLFVVFNHNLWKPYLSALWYRVLFSNS